MDINEFEFYNRDIGYATATSQLLFKTLDGGRSWNVEIDNKIKDTEFYANFILDIEYISQEHPIYCTGSGKIYRYEEERTGMQDNTLNDALYLFPNPASSILKIHIGEGYNPAGNIEIYDVVGERVKSVETTFKTSFQIDISGWRRAFTIFPLIPGRVY